MRLLVALRTAEFQAKLGNFSLIYSCRSTIASSTRRSFALELLACRCDSLHPAQRALRRRHLRSGSVFYLGAASVYRVALLQFREQNLFNVVDLIRAIPGVAFLGVARAFTSTKRPRARLRYRLVAWSRSILKPANRSAAGLPKTLRVSPKPYLRQDSRQCWSAPSDRELLTRSMRRPTST